MHVSKRLEAIVSMIEPCVSLADVGSDHGYVPVLACESGKIERALAIDIHSGPLQKTVMNIERHGLAHVIAVRQCDGLSGVAPAEVETVVIAGMGGMLTRDILRQGAQVVKELRQLILQPQRDVDTVRRTVHELGFKIADELFLYEEGTYYTIINCHKGMDVLYNHSEYLLGKKLIEKKDENLRVYLQTALRKLEKIKKQLVDPQICGRAKARMNELNEQERIYREVLSCL